MKKLTCLLFFGLSFMTNSSHSDTLSIERIFSSPALDGGAPRKLQVSPDGKRVTFLQGKSSDYERLDLWEYDLKTKTTQMLFNSDDLSSGPEELSDEEKARRERMRLSGTGIVSYEWSKDGTALLFPLAGDLYYFKLGTKKALQLLDTPEFETDFKLSPKGNYVSYVRNQDLYIKHIKNGLETRLTHDGQGNIKNAMAEFVAQEEMSRMTGYWWSPDERYIAFTQIDESPVQEVIRSEIYADSIKMITQRYPAAGTPNVLIKLAVMNVANQQTQWIDLGADKDIYLNRVDWTNSSDVLTYQIQPRNQQLLQLKAYAVHKNTQLTLLEEKSDTWLNLHDDLYFLADNQHFVWASERDGYKHLYLYKNSGELIKQLTKGNWVVNDIKAIDEKKQLIYFTGRVDTPTEAHLYSVSLKNDELKRITQRRGFHNITFSQDASVYIDDFSTVNTPPQVSLHRASGEYITWLSENAIDAQHPLFAYQDSWVKPQIASFKAEDGTELYYRLYQPADQGIKHPVIVYTYGGPHAQQVTNSWAGNRGLLFQHWVNKGYVVFTLDNRGANYRGKAFEEPIYKKMGEIEVQDQVAGVKFLRTLPYVDETRIGIHGHSYGGYLTLMSMFKAGDYFQAGVAGAPVTDWELYDTFYTERYMGNPKTDKEAYVASSVFPYAKDLKGDLLIYHGMADDNVLFTNSTMLYKHLQDLAIPFESMDYPGKKHSINGKNTGIHLYKTITNFFDKHFGINQGRETNKKQFATETAK